MGIYREYLHGQVAELLSNYGKIDLIFFDYTSKWRKPEEWDAKGLLEMVRRLQPDILVNDRLSYRKDILYGDYCTPELFIPDSPITIAGKPTPWETCATLNGNWGYNASATVSVSPASIAESLARCASMDGNLLLNVGPDPLGNIPEDSAAVLGKIGSWLKANGDSIYGAGSSELIPPGGMVYTQKGDSLYLHMLCTPLAQVVLPGLRGKVRDIKRLCDGVRVPQVLHWGTELLKEDDLRISPPKKRSGEFHEVLEIPLLSTG